MIYLSGFLSGVLCKLYDDLYDNPFLQPYKNEICMETLKGLTTICFTHVSLEDPLFFLILYLGNVAHSISNKESYINPYESSLFIFYGLLFFYIDYTKIKRLSIYTIIIILICGIGSFMEPYIEVFLNIKHMEYSYYKCFIRIYIFLGSTFIFYLIKYKPFDFFKKNHLENILVLLLCGIGYNLISSIVQIYSLIQDSKRKGHKNELIDESKKKTHEENPITRENKKSKSKSKIKKPKKKE
jgi:hypothetical protein